MADDSPTLAPEHAQELEQKRAIPPDVARAHGVYTATQGEDLPEGVPDYWTRCLPAKLLPWRMNGQVEWQIGPDDRERWDKYLFRKGAEVPLNQLRDTGSGPVLIVEGFWQSLVASVYDQASAVYGMAGADGWSHTDLSFCDGRPVIVILDGDVRTNRNVFDAASSLLESLSLVGADSVRFALLPARPRAQGLDDFLARLPEPNRAATMGRLLAQAKDLPGRAPAKKRGGASIFFGDGGLLVDTLATTIAKKYPVALTAETKLAMYVDGAYRIDRAFFMAKVAAALEEDNRPSHRAAVEEHMIGLAKNAGMLLPDHLNEPLLNLQNGMLDLRTGRLQDHDPALMSSVQFPVAWDPGAECPTYVDWLDEVIPDQAEDLEEVAAQVLDPSRTPHKALLAYGPARSGKSTFLRLLEALVGDDNRSSVGLHQLVENRFAAANVYGKKLNTSADLSANHIEDLSIFKMMIGEDSIHGDRKYGGQFSFKNRALFAFSANDPPTVGESSRAYTERVKPFRFGRSFAGREKPAIEVAMHRELEGLLVRLVEAWRRREQRGRWLTTLSDVQTEFETRSDRVRQFVEERCVIHPVDPAGSLSLPAGQFETARNLYRAFKRWSEDSGGYGMGERKVIDRLTCINGVVYVRREGDRARGLNVTILPEGAEPPGRTGKVTPSLPISVSGKMKKESRGHGEGRAETARSARKASSSPDQAPFVDDHKERSPVASELDQDVVQDQDGPAHTPQRAVSHPLVLDPNVAGPSDDQAKVHEQPPSEDEGTRVNAPGSVGEPEQDGPSAVKEETEEEEVTVVGKDHFIHPIRDVDLRPHGARIAFDLETSGVEDMWTDEPGTHVRVAGWSVGNHDPLLTFEVPFLVRHLEVAGTLIGHNILGYDLSVLHRHHGLPAPVQLLNGGMQLHDTKLVEALIDPPPARMKEGEARKHYGLDSVAARYGSTGKSLDLKKMAAHYARLERNRNPGYDRAGFELIPWTNPRQNQDLLHYLRQDVILTRLIAQKQGPLTEYAVREHKIAALAAQISINGFRVNVEELGRRVDEGREQRRRLLEELYERHGLPRVDAKGKPYKAPQATKDGKLAIATAFDVAGVPLDDFRPKARSGAPDLSKDYMEELAERYSHLPKVVQLAELVQELNGVRPIYDTIQQHLAGDRVHPSIELRQASGRWSVTKPGLTVVGKHGGRVHEREVFLAEEGHVIVAVDLAQVDARAVAAHSQDVAYMTMFEPGKDLHTEVALRIWDDPSRRQDAKVMAHGWNYGLGAAKMSSLAGVSYEEAQQFDRTMRAEFPDLVKWQEEVREQGQAGELLDNGFGRKLKVDPERAYTQAPALMGQSAARDLMMEGLLRLDPALHPALRLQVHDELVLSVPEADAEEAAHEVQRALTFEWRGVPIVAEFSVGGRTWASAYEK